MLFEVVTRRYEARRPLLLSTNKPFAQWGEVFPHAACVVTLVDRLIHRAEVIDIEAESYRLKEAKELNAARTKQRKTKKPLTCRGGARAISIPRSSPVSAGTSPLSGAFFTGELHRNPALLRARQPKAIPPPESPARCPPDPRGVS